MSLFPLGPFLSLCVFVSLAEKSNVLRHFLYTLLRKRRGWNCQDEILFPRSKNRRLSSSSQCGFTFFAFGFYFRFCSDVESVLSASFRRISLMGSYIYMGTLRVYLSAVLCLFFRSFARGEETEIKNTNKLSVLYQSLNGTTYTETPFYRTRLSRITDYGVAKFEAR